ncbi:MAG TPA: efflux RND transporter periplasmic adaptor subunit [Aequorivita sp.]|nr:efflux RND transporter periplasmic adaptor subunit [Aequorivita sp.]
MNLIKYIFLFSTLFLLSCNSNKGEEAKPISTEEKDESIHVSKAQFESAKMEIGNLTQEPFAKTIHTNGIIDVPPQNRAVISAFSGGYVKDTPLLIGDIVKKGDRLVTLENPEFITIQQNYLETAEQLSYLKSEYERQKTMFEENITSEKSYLKAESEYKTAAARANSLIKSLQMLNINTASVLQGNIVSAVNIYSPINGYITQVMVNMGTYVSPADKIMEVMNTDHIHLELNVFERDLLQLKKGQEIVFRVPEASKENYTGDVYLVGTSIESKTRMAMVHGHIDEDNETNFAAGMFVEADIITGVTNQMALPEDAVVEFEGKNYVLLLENESKDEYMLTPLEVKIDSNYKGYTSFKTELPKDAKFLTKGGFVLLQVEEDGGHGH